MQLCKQLDVGRVGRVATTVSAHMFIPLCVIHDLINDHDIHPAAAE